MKKILAILLLMTSTSSAAHIHEDWATVHRIHPETHETIHTASTNSIDHRAILTIDCDSNMSLYELQASLKGNGVTSLYYSIDYSKFKPVNDFYEKRGYRSTFVHNVKDEDYGDLSELRTLAVRVESDYSIEMYSFSLKGLDEAYSTLMELCE